LHVALSSKLQSGLLRVIQTYDEAAWTGTRDASISLSDEHPAAFKARMEGANSMLEETEESENSLAEDPATPVPSSLTKFGQVHDLSITFIHGPSTSMSTLERIDRCLRNIPGIDILPVEDLAAYEVMDVSAVEWLAARVGQSELMESVEDVEGESSEGRFEDVSATEASTPSTVNA
jgi:large subunit ribosomal protein L4